MAWRSKIFKNCLRAWYNSLLFLKWRDDHFEYMNLPGDPLNIVDILNLVLLKYFDCDFLPSQVVNAELDFSKCAFANGLAQNILTNIGATISTSFPRCRCLVLGRGGRRGWWCLGGGTMILFLLRIWGGARIHSIFWRLGSTAFVSHLILLLLFKIYLFQKYYWF